MPYANFNDSERAAMNRKRLLKMYPTMRPKIEAVIRDMEGKGWKPVIDGQVHRTPAEQAALKAKGVSKVSYSYHTVTGPNGRPESLAADIVDVRYGWDAPPKYWLQLAACAEAHGLTTGIRWGLNKVKRALLESILRKKDWGAKYAMGWDAAHVEAKGIGLSQAKAGKRP